LLLWGIALLSFCSAADYFAIEASSWSFGVLFLVLFFVGRAQNRRIADQWYGEAFDRGDATRD
jgi:hypothetical protein